MIQETNGYTPDKADEKLRPVAELYILTKLLKKDMSKKEFENEVKDDLGNGRGYMTEYMEDLYTCGDVAKKRLAYRISDSGKARFFKAFKSFEYSTKEGDRMADYSKYKEFEKTLKNYIILFD